MQSAARSKVRKLRYIAELDSKSAALQQQVTGMTAEMRALQDGASRLGASMHGAFFIIPLALDHFTYDSKGDGEVVSCTKALLATSVHSKFSPGK